MFPSYVSKAQLIDAYQLYGYIVDFKTVAKKHGLFDLMTEKEGSEFSKLMQQLWALTQGISIEDSNGKVHDEDAIFFQLGSCQQKSYKKLYRKLASFFKDIRAKETRTHVLDDLKQFGEARCRVMEIIKSEVMFVDRCSQHDAIAKIGEAMRKHQSVLIKKLGISSERFEDLRFGFTQYLNIRNLLYLNSKVKEPQWYSTSIFHITKFLEKRMKSTDFHEQLALLFKLKGYYYQLLDILKEIKSLENDAPTRDSNALIKVIDDISTFTLSQPFQRVARYKDLLGALSKSLNKLAQIYYEGGLRVVSDGYKYLDYSDLQSTYSDIIGVIDCKIRDEAMGVKLSEVTTAVERYAQTLAQVSLRTSGGFMFSSRFSSSSSSSTDAVLSTGVLHHYLGQVLTHLNALATDDPSVNVVGKLNPIEGQLHIMMAFFKPFALLAGKSEPPRELINLVQQYTQLGVMSLVTSFADSSEVKTRIMEELQSLYIVCPQAFANMRIDLGYFLPVTARQASIRERLIELSQLDRAAYERMSDDAQHCLLVMTRYAAMLIDKIVSAPTSNDTLARVERLKVNLFDKINDSVYADYEDITQLFFQLHAEITLLQRALNGEEMRLGLEPEDKGPVASSSSAKH